LNDIQSVTINGTTIAIGHLGDGSASNTINTANGTLTVTSYDVATGVAHYTYDLTSPAANASGTDAHDSFQLTVTDASAATSAPATITVTVVDDVPHAVADFNTIAEGSTAAITGNVLANDISGADIPASFVSWASTTAAHGTFTDTGNGTYSYVLNNADSAVSSLPKGQTLTESFQLHDAGS